MATRVILRPGTNGVNGSTPMRFIRPGTRVLNALTSNETPQALQSGRGPSISHEEFEQRGHGHQKTATPFGVL